MRMGKQRIGALLMSLVLALASVFLGGRAALAAPPQTPAELFRIDHVWTIHLTFTPTQWDAMEPRRAGGGPGGPGFGPGMFLGPAFLGLGDADKNGTLSKAELTALADKWFTQWDNDTAGKIDT